jgi:hypothetical protein
MAQLSPTERHQVEQALGVLASVRSDLLNVEETPASTFRHIDAVIDEIRKATSLDDDQADYQDDEPF